MAASSSSSLAFSVRRGEPRLVVPAKPTPRGLKQLSDIDVQEFLRFQAPVIIFFQSNPLMEGKDPARIIREALAKTLVFYYPFAGRLIEGPNRKLMVDCTGEGVLFTDADADVTLEQLGDTIQPPCPCLEELLYDVPRSGGILGCPLLSVQVTRLLCGGCIIAFRFCHTMCDGPGFVQFLQTIGEMAQGAVAPSLPPVWQRELLNARDPPRITCTHNEYEDEADDTQIGKDHSNMVHRSFFFGPKQIKSIRNHLPPHRNACTTFELLTACLWKCRVLSFALDPTETVRVSCTVNVRRNKQILNLPRGYYGNAFAMPAAVSKADLVCKNNLEYALQLVQKAKASVNEEYMRSLADFVVMKGGRAPRTISRNFIVSENRHGFGDVDFGWGKPLYAGLAGAVSIISFYMRFKNSKGEDGIVVPIWLPSPVMEKFEQELAKMTREPVAKSYDIKPTRIMSML